jgi:hypothetical protein
MVPGMLLLRGLSLKVFDLEHLWVMVMALHRVWVMETALQRVWVMEMTLVQRVQVMGMALQRVQMMGMALQREGLGHLGDMKMVLEEAGTAYSSLSLPHKWDYPSWCPGLFCQIQDSDQTSHQ